MNTNKLECPEELTLSFGGKTLATYVLKKEKIKNKVDWSKVKPGTPVLCWDDGDADDWKESQYFFAYINNVVYTTCIYNLNWEIFASEQNLILNRWDNVELYHEK